MPINRVTTFVLLLIDFDFTLKYDLPLDFYVKGTLNLNYDNQPAVKGNDLDYVFTTGFGWEL